MNDGYVDADSLKTRLDEDLMREVLTFHARGRVASHERVFGTLFYPGYSPEALKGFEFNEIPLSPLGGKRVELTESVRLPEALSRQGSVRDFDDQPLPFSLLQRLVRGALCCRDGASGGRNYPSGGGLFPIEAFLVPLGRGSVTGMAPAVHRVLANSRALEIIDPIDPEALKASLFRPPMERNTAPSFAIAYAANFERCLVKYRFRGYRNALIEVGAMIQQVDLCAKQLGLGTVPWAWFDEYEWSRMLGTNPARLPLVMLQLVGKPATAGDLREAPAQ